MGEVGLSLSYSDVTQLTFDMKQKLNLIRLMVFFLEKNELTSLHIRSLSRKLLLLLILYLKYLPNFLNYLNLPDYLNYLNLPDS